MTRVREPLGGNLTNAPPSIELHRDLGAWIWPAEPPEELAQDEALAQRFPKIANSLTPTAAVQAGKQLPEDLLRSFAVRIGQRGAAHVIEGSSYRVRESEEEAAARRRRKKPCPQTLLRGWLTSTCPKHPYGAAL